MNNEKKQEEFICKTEGKLGEVIYKHVKQGDTLSVMGVPVWTKEGIGIDVSSFCFESSGLAWSFWQGRVVSDAELNKQGKTPRLSFTIAVNEKWAKDNKTTQFPKCTIWGNLAIKLKDRIKKGRMLFISGRPRVSSVKEDDKYQTFFGVNVEDVIFLDPEKGVKGLAFLTVIGNVVDIKHKENITLFTIVPQFSTEQKEETKKKQQENNPKIEEEDISFRADLKITDEELKELEEFTKNDTPF
ncbi:MAG: single-stranded DNA-binding protein [bacterium]